MLKSFGRIHYNDREGFRLTVEVNQDFSNYYRSLIPKYLRVSRPRYSAHITVVRPEMEIPPKISYWENYKNEKVGFFYDPYVYFGKGFYWLNVWSNRLEEIRKELGLPILTNRYTIPPKGFLKTFHLTIGNTTEKYLYEN